MIIENSCAHRRVCDVRNSDVTAVFGLTTIRPVCGIGRAVIMLLRRVGGIQ